jgi:hypothetical protein
MRAHPEGILAKRGSWVASIGNGVKIGAGLSLRKNVRSLGTRAVPSRATPWASRD